MRQRHDKYDRTEVDREDADLFPERRLEEQGQQNGVRAGNEHSQKYPDRPEQCGHRQAKQHNRCEAEVAEIVDQAAPEHFHDVGRAGDVNSKVSLVQLMHNALQMPDEFLCVASLGEHDDVAGLAVLGYQQPVPERTREPILKTLWPGGQTLDGAYRVDRLDLSSESLDPAQVSR